MVDIYDDFEPSKVHSLLDWRLPNCDEPVSEPDFAKQLRERGALADAKFTRVLESAKLIPADEG